MRFPPSLLDEIRARVPVSEVVGKRVKLRRAGRGFSGLCPFHQEKTPSFTCDDARGTYKCFGCGEGGDVFGFVQKTEGLSFPEAVERLAGEAGVSLPKPDAREAARERVRTGLTDVVEMAARFFQECLAGRQGEAARAYLARRRIDAEAKTTFRIGYAPNSRNALREHLAGKGVSVEQMVEAGLLVSGPDIPVAYDRFRDRIMFPIEDLRGRVVAFGGRALSSEVTAKYLNSPETPLFHKGSMLFNGQRARAASREASGVLVVEGYIDVIALHQAGIRNAVAPLGTALGEDQIRLLWSMADEPLVCFDGDRAGEAAAYRVVERVLPLLKPGKSLNFAFLPEGKDPDELVAAEGREGFSAAIGDPAPLVDVIWHRETRAANLETPERRAALEARLTQLAASAGDPRVAWSYKQAFRLRLASLFFSTDRARGRAMPAAQAMPGTKLISDRAGENLELERVILGLCVEMPELLESHMEQFVMLAFSTDVHTAFQRELYRVLVEHSDAPMADLYDGIDERFFAVLNEVFGDKAETRVDAFILPRGHRLRRRFPILACCPPHDFLEACFVHFLDFLQIRATDWELKQIVSAAPAEFREADAERVPVMMRDLDEQRGRFQVQDGELADRAKLIRTAFGAAGGASGLLADLRAA